MNQTIKSLNLLYYSYFYSFLFVLCSCKEDTPLVFLESTERNNEIFLTFNDTLIHVESKKTETFKLPPVNISFLTDTEDPLFVFNSSSPCVIEEWNNIRTESYPHYDLHAQWLTRKHGMRSYLYGKTPGLFNAFVYTDHIVVTLTTENLYGKKVYCRYYDCQRNEIRDVYESVVFPESTVFCPRRVGVKYISISTTLNEKPEQSIPLIPRFKKPEHYFTVCMAPLYGEESKFLQISEFIEYYKLQGATFFHIYLRNVTDYDRVLLDDYVRTGEVEVIKMHDHYWRHDWLWHNPQINDCHFRSKHFSKWTAFVDLDEHIEMKNDKFKRIVDLLDLMTDPNVVNLHFRVQWVIKDENLPTKYIDDEQILNEMVSRKYHNTSVIGGHWNQPKCIIRPDKVALMSIHGPNDIYHGVMRTYVDPKIGIVRHYRNVQIRVFPGALKIMMDLAPFNLSDIAEWIRDRLAKAVLQRIKWIYDITEVSCEMRKYAYHIYGLKYKC